MLGFDHQIGAVEGMCDSSGFTEKALSEVFFKGSFIFHYYFFLYSVGLGTVTIYCISDGSLEV